MGASCGGGSKSYETMPDEKDFIQKQNHLQTQINRLKQQIRELKLAMSERLTMDDLCMIHQGGIQPIRRLVRGRKRSYPVDREQQGKKKKKMRSNGYAGAMKIND